MADPLLTVSNLETYYGPIMAIRGVSFAVPQGAIVTNLIQTEVERVNKRLARVETIKKFRLIEQILTAEDEELTPTMKLRRSFVNTKYKELIDGMYAES